MSGFVMESKCAMADLTMPGNGCFIAGNGDSRTLAEGSRARMKYLEDFRTGEIETIQGYELTASAIVEFARAWDPQPMHTDPESAAAASFGGLIASGSHLVAITVRQLVTHSAGVAVIAGLSWDEVRFLKPARAGDVLSLTRECVEVRTSGSKPDRGVVRNRITLRNQREELLVSYIDTLLVARRPAGVAEGPLAGSEASPTSRHMDVASNREEALGDASEARYRKLAARFAEALEDGETDGMGLVE